MPSVLAYHRPSSLEEAVTLLAEPNTRAIGGGTVVVPDARIARAVGTTVVDLQATGLSTGCEPDGEGRFKIGAMTRLGDLIDDDQVPVLLRDLARRELPSTLRNQATVGGTAALGDPDSVLLAGLLVHGATVQIHGAEDKTLARSLEDCIGQQIITSVSVETDGVGSVAVTGRTPADVPIVAAIARRSGAGDRVVLTGVAPTPVEVDPADPTGTLDPRGDFRGSADYRRHLAATLTRRAIERVTEGVR